MFRAIFYAVTVLGLLLTAGAAPAQVKEKDKDEKKEKENEDLQSVKQINGKFLPEWLKDLSSKDPAVRETAMNSIVWFGKSAHQAVPYLINELKGNNDQSLRLTACMTIARIGLGTRPADVTNGVAELSRLVSTEYQSNIRYQAAATLASLGEEGRPAITSLRQSMNDFRASWQIRKACAAALGSVGLASRKDEGPDARAVEGLIGPVLKDACAQVRQQAVNSLIALGPTKKAETNQRAIAELKPVYLRDPDKVVMIWARMATMRMNDKISEEHVSAIGAQLKSRDFNTRMEALKALAMIGKEAQSQVPNIVEIALEDKYLEVVLRGIETLGAIGDRRPMVMNALKRLADDKEPQVKSLAEDAIKWLTKPKEDKNKKPVPRKDLP